MEAVIDAMSAGAVSVVNGVWALLTLFSSPTAVALTVAAASCAWLARVEIAEMDRMAAKPDVGRH